jgi:hypothetical protein
LILVSFSLTEVATAVAEPVVLFGFMVGMLVVAFTILGIAMPNVYAFMLPKGDEERWMLQYRPGPGMILVEGDLPETLNKRVGKKAKAMNELTV